MTIFEKIKAAIERFKRTAAHAEHIALAEALAEKLYVIEWLHKRVEELERIVGIKGEVTLPGSKTVEISTGAVTLAGSHVELVSDVAAAGKAA